MTHSTAQLLKHKLGNLLEEMAHRGVLPRAGTIPDLEPEVYPTLSALRPGVQAEINWEVVEIMDRVESDDTARFGKSRTARKKKLRDPDDVFIEAEQRRRELARQAKCKAKRKKLNTIQSKPSHKR
jgi:hypothetical protein